jgi:rubrerythrin
MDYNTKSIAEGLKKAIQGENDGYFFYLSASQQTSDSKGKEIFSILASEEMKHKEYLELYQKLSTPEDIDFLAESFEPFLYFHLIPLI